jgi:hypothetical protein
LEDYRFVQGKSLLLSHLFSQLKSTNVATIHCSALTNAVHVIQKLSQARHTHSKRFGAVFFLSKRIMLYQDRLGTNARKGQSTL